MNHPVREVGTENDEFPSLLREIPSSPNKLYVRGVMPSASNKILAVVGSRKMSSYGKLVCEQLIAGLRGYPITIVSGLALGVDACAHEVALSVGLHCVAVPGSSIEDSEIAPRSNFSLAKGILNSNGALLSEFPAGYIVGKHSFPLRNRIMVGLSHAVLLIEAGEKSGTLVTARLAGEYNRDLLAVPGSIFSENSKGVHQFIKIGATPVCSSEDILDALGYKSTQSNAHADTGRSNNEMLVLDLLDQPRNRNELLAASLLDAAELNSTITMLELDGLVSEVSGVYIKK